MHLQNAQRSNELIAKHGSVHIVSHRGQSPEKQRLRQSEVGLKQEPAAGMWPDTGSLYAQDPLPPTYTGAYQGWTQYCTGVDGDFGQCGVGTGNLCTWPNATQANFSQSNYESCMRANNVTACQVDESTVTALRPLFERYAPGSVLLHVISAGFIPLECFSSSPVEWGVHKMHKVSIQKCKAPQDPLQSIHAFL